MVFLQSVFGSPGFPFIRLASSFSDTWFRPLLLCLLNFLFRSPVSPSGQFPFSLRLFRQIHVGAAYFDAQWYVDLFVHFTLSALFFPY